MSESQITVFIGILLMVLGCSFAYKTVQAGVMGRVLYWSGFLPMTIVSPFFTHLPPGEKSLIKSAEGVWVHLLMGPIFAIVTVLCFCAGADMVGLPGTNTLNFILNAGNETRPISVSFDKHRGYKFPMLDRAGKQFMKLMSGQYKISDKDKLLQEENQGSLQDAVNNAGG